ncbi:MAG: serine hydrolase [Flavobacteriaceae bacterium]
MKTLKTPPFLLNHFCFILLVSVLISSCNGIDDEGTVSNEVVAYIFPLEKQITVDGDLSDWPSDLTSYPIQNLELGDSLSTDNDYRGSFRIGYDLKRNEIFIGVEVQDQSLVKDTSENANWNTQDGAELYLDDEHLKSGSLLTQYSAYGEDRLTFGAKENWDNIEMKKQENSTTRVYEWKITLAKPIEIGRAIGLDLAISDKDEDDSFSWISWTKGTQKTANPERCGTVIFATPGTQTQLVHAKLDKSKLQSKAMPIAVSISDINNPKMWFQAVPDSLGNYSFLVPPGDYNLEIPEKLLSWDYRFYRVASEKSETFAVADGASNEIPTISAEQVPEPNLWVNKGLLHSFGKKEEGQVDEFIETYRKYYNIPGVSLALIKDGKIAYHKTYGFKNTQTKEAVDEKTLFEAASITKPVFAYVVLRLAEKGIIDMDKPLYQYLKFEDLEAYPEYQKMTARHVLIHRSGLPNWGRRMINVPGEKYGYSGEGFEYLKRVVVSITGKRIEQILDEELITPFDLYHMEFSDNEALRAVVSSGHIMGQPTNWDIPGEAGMAFSMHTEAKAFSKFALLLLAQKGLSPKMYKEFMTIHTESNPEYWNNKDRREGAGLGIFIRETDLGNTFNHGGNNGDFKCLFEVFQDLEMGYIVYTNSDTGSELSADLTYLLVEGGEPEN